MSKRDWSLRTYESGYRPPSVFIRSEVVQETVTFLFNLFYTVPKVIYQIVVTLIQIVFPEKPKSVQGEIVLITGAGHGIGKELALEYARKGATVVCWDINKEANDKTVSEILTDKTSKAYGFVCDVSKREDVLRVAKQVKETIGNVTILVNNAGIINALLLDEFSPELVQKTIDTNLMSNFWTLEAFYPWMKENNRGHIVGISGTSGIAGQANLVPYSASKFAIVGLMESLDEEIRTLKLNKIFTTTVIPYMVHTEFIKKPKINYTYSMAMYTSNVAAKRIIYAQRTNQGQLHLPCYLSNLIYFARLLPYKSAAVIRDFIAGGVNRSQ